eukprot:TRINITY_DN503_c0_g1_i2.p2 TRINITY_DN503_c0_g1~~TRINITY_DN503_c0_g1_i2.p2  ORF type:complete len:183 (-),score=47.13 TRINITY_DN503_c0_g1_i2:302-850(-)
MLSCCQVEPLQDWVRAGKPIWGTCAGLILLAKETVAEDAYFKPDTPSEVIDRRPGLLGGLDAVVHRNFFGSQVRSFEKQVQAPVLEGVEGSEPYNGFFIRAPAVIETGAQVSVLANLDNEVLSSMKLPTVRENGVAVALQQDNVLGTSFHPELTKDTRWHLYFLNMVCQYLDFGSPYVIVKN